MLKRRLSSSSFTPNGRRVLSTPGSSLLGGGAKRKKLIHVRSSGSGLRRPPSIGGENESHDGGGSGRFSTGSTCSTSSGSATSTNGSSSCQQLQPRSKPPRNLLAPGTKLVLVKRAPILCGLSVNGGGNGNGLHKKFQRPTVQTKRRTRRAKEEQQMDAALRDSSLGQRRRMDGMSKLMARAGRGLAFKLPGGSGHGCVGGGEKKEEEVVDDKPFEPLCVWKSPHEGGEPKGLPPVVTTIMQADEYGVEEPVQVEQPAPNSSYSKISAFVPPILCKWLRPHQREGVLFLYQCTMSLRSFHGAGCILADDMGLGKTLQSITLLYTLLKTSITANNEPSVKRAIIVCPCSLVKNWDNEIIKWIANGGPGPGKGVTPPRVMALAELDRATIEKNIDAFCRTSLYSVLIVSYETLRTHVGRITSYSESKCDLLICDEAHRLKNRDNMTTRALNSLPCRKRVLLTGTPMQNDLEEFYAMVDFTNPGILGSPEEFRKHYLFPILRGREPDATERQKNRMMQCQRHLSEVVNEFILRRVNTLNAQHLPAKLVQVVCCDLTDVQRNMYEYLIGKMEQNNVLEGKQSNALGWIQLLMKLSNHPQLVADEDPSYHGGGGGGGGGRGAKRGAKKSYNENEGAMTESINGVSKFLPEDGGYGGGSSFGRRNTFQPPVRPEYSGKMFLLYRLMVEMRRPHCRDKIVIVSNYTQTLDLIGRMCSDNNWGFCRLDGSIGMKKRQKMVDDFNDPGSHLIAFLLSSKAGGCGLNLIGGNRLVLFDPDWNPAVDKQAAARCWRDGQKKRCFTYRFLATGTVEEKIFQRQLSKEGLQSVVDDKEQVNALSTRDLRNLFKLRTNTPSDTHDKLHCKRCKTIHENTEHEAKIILPLQLRKCRDLLTKLSGQADAAAFLKFLNPEEYGVTKEQYEKLVKQPMDLRSIRDKIAATLASAASSSATSSSNSNHNTANTMYASVSHFSRDVNRIWSNVLKVWSPGEHEIANAAHRLQNWWVDEWSNLVPELMALKSAARKGGNASCAVAAEANKENVAEGEERSNEEKPEEEERSEDFQEQIGMPDEENMRSWSHHFSTETCDDPVFRAAMKGYNNVSFVFGLEVTWDLIQQRQQEEEERAAMEELNRLQELEEGEIEALAGLEETPTVKPATPKQEADGAKTDVVDSKEAPKESNDAPTPEGGTAETPIELDEDCPSSVQWTLSRVLSVNEIESSTPLICSTDGCHLPACTAWKSSDVAQEERLVCLDCQSAHFGGWPNGLEILGNVDLLDCIQQRCSKGNCPSVGTVPESRPSVEAHGAKSKSSAQWSCSQCTFLNSPKKKMCGECFAAAP